MAMLTRPEDTIQQEPQLASFRRVLKNRRFLLLWMAQLISMTALNAANFAVVVQVNDRTHSVLLVGTAIIAFTLPAVPFGAIAGTIVDRLNKRTVLWVSNVLRAVTMLLMFVSLQYDRSHLWPLFVLVFMTSFIGQFFIPAESATIPLLVDESELMPALSLFNITLNLSMAIGFLLLGRIIAALFPPFALHLGPLTLHVESTDMVFVVVALLFVVCALLILRIAPQAFAEKHLRKAEPAQGEEPPPTTIRTTLLQLWRDLVTGWRIVHADHMLFFAVIQLSLVGVLMQLIGELAPTFVEQILHHPSQDMAIIMAPAAVGLVGASLFVPRIAERVGKWRLASIGLLTVIAGFLLIPVIQWLVFLLAGPQGASSIWLLLLIIVLTFILGAAMSCVNVPTVTLMQEHAPEAGRARVFSLQFMLYNAGTIPVLLFAGAIAQFLGLDQLILVLSVSLFLFWLWGVRYVRGKQRQ